MTPTDIPLRKPALEALYRHLGADDTARHARLRTILREFYCRMAADVMIGFFFIGKNLDEIADQQGSFLLRAMGATPSYAGKAPANAHDALPPILSGHFDRRLRLLEETLHAHGVPAEDIRTWVGFESAFRDAIVAK